VLAIGGCDKNMPGAMIAIARLNIPAIFVYGGTIKPGCFKDKDVDIVSVFEAIGQHSAGKISDEELEARHAELKSAGGYKYPDHQTPWQEIQRTLVEPLDRGMTLEPATKYRDVARRSPPRDNH